MLRIFTATWNMMGREPSLEDFLSLLHPETIHHDLYVMGSQEACTSIAGSLFKPSKQRIVDLCKAALGEQYFMVHSTSL